MLEIHGYMVYKSRFLHVQSMRAELLISDHLSLLLHLAQVISHLELGSSLLLHLLDSHARGNFSKSQTTILAINLEDTL